MRYVTRAQTGGPFLALTLALCLLAALAGCGAPTGLNLAPGPTSTPTRTPAPSAPTPARVLGVAIVTRTGGDGVYMRSLPSIAPETRTDLWKDGTRLEIVGEDMEAAGTRWMKVKDPKGGVGYIPSEYLITATPTRTPVVTATPTPPPATAVATATPMPTAVASPQATNVPVMSPTATLAPTTAPTTVPTTAPPTRTATALPTAVPSKPGAPTATPLATMMPFPTAAPTATIDPSAAKLELLSTTESRSVALATVEGSVRNLSNGSFENVQVVVQYYSSDDRPVTRGTAALASTLLGPGQTSYFKCLVPIEPGMARFTISFVDQAGQPIPSVDRR